MKEAHTHTHTLSLAQTNKPAHTTLMVRIDWLIERGTEGPERASQSQATGGEDGAPAGQTLLQNIKRVVLMRSKRSARLTKHHMLVYLHSRLIHITRER